MRPPLRAETEGAAGLGLDRLDDLITAHLPVLQQLRTISSGTPDIKLVFPPAIRPYLGIQGK